MYPRGHAGGALILATLVGAYSLDSVVLFCLLVITTMWFSILPDTDVVLRQYIKNISHRGFTHTVWFVILASGLSYIISLVLSSNIQYLNPSIIVSGVFIGLLSHILLDSLNSAGVRPFSLFGRFQYHIQIKEIDSKSRTYNNAFFLLGISFLLVGLIIVYS